MQANLGDGVNAYTRIEDRPQSEWDTLAETKQFKEMIQKKKAFLVPATIFFFVYYFTLPVLAGYFKPIMAAKVTESINFGYVFALSQFVMAWILAYVYTRKANQFDKTASEMRQRIERGHE